MSELYKQSIIEAKRLKEIAEIDAKNKIIEAVAPVIKKMIAAEAADANRFLFGEEDVPGHSGGIGSDDIMSTLPPEVEEPGVTPGDKPNAAPISPSDGLVGMPMPDDEGKITVDFQQLFSLGGGGAAAVAPPVTAAGGGAGMEAPGAEMPGTPPGGEMAAPVAPPPVAPVGPQGTAGAAPTQPPLTPGLEPNPEEEPTPVIAGEAKIAGFKDEVRIVAEKIDYLYFKGNVPMLVKESLKSKLFTLCGKLDEMVNEDIISSKKARLAENKLEFLFMKLNEAEMTTSYKENKGAPMTTLREFAAKLFEEDALGTATADKATAHAEKVSGVAPGVDLFKEGSPEAEEEAKKVEEAKETGEVDEMSKMSEALLGEKAPASTAFGDGKPAGEAQNKSPKVHNPNALAKEKGAGIVEGAPASSAFGNGEKAKGAENTSPKVHKPGALVDEKGNNSILEFDEKELREAVARLRKENLARRLAAVKKEAALKGTDKNGHLKPPSVPEGDQGSQKPAGGKAPAQKELKECDMEEESSMGTGSAPMTGGSAPQMPSEHTLPHEEEEEEDIPGMDGGGGGGNEVELTFQIDVDDLEALLNGATEEFVAEPVSGEAAPGEGESALDIDLVGDEEEEEESMHKKGDPLLMDKKPEEEEEAHMPMEGKKPARGGRPAAKPLTEAAVIAKAAKTVKSLQSKLSESQLLTAKALYVSKFAVREDLSQKQKQKIASYLDKAKTLAEAKETYNKIKKILSESTASTQLSGSASKPTSTGSAKLTEVAKSSDQIETARWQLLAGIKNRK